ncbi:MAG: PhoH family protein, partial [Actinobacteria bacterium]|nr:PhoH family protein [Actinomycetota bacterium]
MPVESGNASDSRKSYVLDTSVLLADPAALNRFQEHEVILPIVVISELESKRDHPELGYFARAALRILDDLRVAHGRLDTPMTINESGGTLTVELNHSDNTGLPTSFFRDGTNDSRVLAVARNLKREGRDVVLVTKDLPLRVKASAVGIVAEEYRAELAVSSGWTGITEITLASEVVDQLYQNERVAPTEIENLPVHTGVVIHSSKGSALARVTPDHKLKLVRGDREAFGLHGRSAEQRIALDLLLDNEIGIVSLGGRAGTGKSALAICAGLEAVMERRLHKKIVIFRP